MSDIEKLKAVKELLKDLGGDWFFTIDDYNEDSTGHLLVINGETNEQIDLGIFVS